MLQNAMSTGGTDTAPTGTWSRATEAGNLLVATLGWQGSGTPVPPSGWTTARMAGKTAIYYSPNAPSQSGSVTFGGLGLGNWVLDIMEWDGASTTGVLDKTASSTSGSTEGTTASSGTTATTSSPNELAVATIHALKAVSQTDPTNGYQQLVVGAQGTITTGTYAKVLSASGAEGMSVALSIPARWRGAIATFRSA